MECVISLILVVSLWLATPVAHAQVPLPAQREAPACHKPREPGGTSSAVKVGAQTKTCLISPAQLKPGLPLVDLRSRQDFTVFHITGATNQQLTQLLNQRPANVVVYDSGRLSQDGALLCERLQRFGLNNVRVLEGGIAAWTQFHRDARAMDASRLDDGEVSSVLLAGKSPVVALAPGFKRILADLPARQAGTATQELVLATNAAEVSARLAQRRGGPTTLYWIGGPEQLQSLLQNLLAQDRKREMGPGYSPTCSAL